MNTNLRNITSVFLVIILMGVLSLSVFASDGPAISLKFAADHGPTMPTIIAFQNMAERLDKETSGRIKMEVFPSNQLGDIMEVINGLQEGSIDLSFQGFGMLSRYIPATSVIEYAYAFRDIDHMFKVFESSPVGENIYQMVNDTIDSTVLGVTYYGTRQLTTVSKPVYKPEDVFGMKLRAPDSPIYFANSRVLGGNPTPIALSEVYLALKTGVVDGQENPLSTIYSYKFYEPCKYLNMTSHSINPLIIVVSNRTLEKLSEADREILEKEIVISCEEIKNNVLQAEVDLIEELKAGGMEVIEPDREAFMARAADIIPEDLKKDWGTLYEDIQAVR